MFVFNIMSVMCIYPYYEGKETGGRFNNECKENQEKGCDCGTSKAGGDQKSPENTTDEKAESEKKKKVGQLRGKREVI